MLVQRSFGEKLVAGRGGVIAVERKRGEEMHMQAQMRMCVCVRKRLRECVREMWRRGE